MIICRNLNLNPKNSTIINIMGNAVTIMSTNIKNPKNMIMITIIIMIITMEAVEDIMITIINIIMAIIMNIKYRMMVEMQVLECRLLFCMHYVLNILFS